MDEKKDLFSLSSDIDEVGSRLEELDLLMNVLDDEIEEGYQPPDSFVEWRAIAFARRVPRRQALLRAIQRDFEQCIKELGEISTQLMELYKVQKEATQ